MADLVLSAVKRAIAAHRSQRYLSEPLTSMPLVKKRWPKQNTRIGIAMAIIAPAWIRLADDCTAR